MPTARSSAASSPQAAIASTNVSVSLMAAPSAAGRAPFAVERGAKLGVIVDFAIVAEHRAAVGRWHRLVAVRRQIDDRQTAMSKPDPRLAHRSTRPRHRVRDARAIRPCAPAAHGSGGRLLHRPAMPHMRDILHRATLGRLVGRAQARLRAAIEIGQQRRDAVQQQQSARRRAAPGIARDRGDARRIDGAQRVRDRRHDPGAPRDRRCDLGVAADNDRQLVVVAYMFGFGSTQLLWGPLADRFGRKPVLAVGVLLYVAFAFLCAFAWSFPLLVAGRVAMGASAAVTRVLVVTMVRDLFEGEAMARTMSLVFMVFMLVPVLAPTVGQGILLVGPWRAIFGVLGAYGLLMALWSWRRLPETLHPEYRRSLEFGEIGRAMWATLRDRQSLGYTLALTLTFGALTAYIASVQQIIFDAFKAPGAIGIAFAAIAAPMALDLVAQLARGRHASGCAASAMAGRSPSPRSPLAHVLIALAGLRNAACSSSCRGWRWPRSPSPRPTSARWRWSIWAPSPAPPRRYRA